LIAEQGQDTRETPSANAMPVGVQTAQPAVQQQQHPQQQPVPSLPGDAEVTQRFSSLWSEISADARRSLGGVAGVQESMDWQEKFEAALSLPSDTLVQKLNRARALQNVSTAFGEVARGLAQTIIEESVLP